MYVIKEFYKRTTARWERGEFIGATFYPTFPEILMRYDAWKRKNSNINFKVYYIDYDEYGKFYEEEIKMEKDLCW